MSSPTRSNAGIRREAPRCTVTRHRSWPPGPVRSLSSVLVVVSASTRTGALGPRPGFREVGCISRRAPLAPGGGRKKRAEADPELTAELSALVDPETGGDPMSALVWTTGSTRHLAGELDREGASGLRPDGGADAGGSNGYRLRAWKVELAALTVQTGLAITVCHLPPGNSNGTRSNTGCSRRSP